MGGPGPSGPGREEGHLDVVEGLSLPARYRQGDIARGVTKSPATIF